MELFFSVIVPISQRFARARVATSIGCASLTATHEEARGTGLYLGDTSPLYFHTIYCRIFRKIPTLVRLTASSLTDRACPVLIISALRRSLLRNIRG